MRCYELCQFSLDGLVHRERARPVLEPGQVLVQMKAASLNFRDLMVLGGFFSMPLPLVPIGDGAGVVIEIDPGVDDLDVGDLVCPVFLQGWQSGPKDAVRPQPMALGGPLDGVMRDYAVFQSANLVKVPSHLSALEAATLPTAALTAWNVLTTAGVRPGQTVLVEGTGGVSVFALQFAKMMGARVLATSSDDSKLEGALQLGADTGINYRTNPKWGEAAFRESGRGVDVVVDVGGQATLAQACAAVREGGFIGCVGAVGGFELAVDGLSLVFKEARIQGFVVGSRQLFTEMCEAIGQHKLKPIIAQEFGFDDLSAAYGALKSAGHIGKIGIRF